MIHFLIEFFFFFFPTGYKLERFNIHENYKNPNVINTLEFNEELIQIALNKCDSPYGWYGRTGVFCFVEKNFHQSTSLFF